MQRQLTTQQLEHIQIDYGMVYLDFGLATERRIGPTRGGATFTATATIRDIEYDGRKGKTKGLQVIDEINAMLSFESLDLSMDDLAVAMPWATYGSSIVSGKTANVGVIASSAYATNFTMFAKMVGGSYKKITLYNAMAENAFSLAASPKAEGGIALEIYAHWSATDDTADLFKVEEVLTMGNDTTAPTVVTVPADAATGVVVTDNLTATFSKAINQADMTSSHFVLAKVSDGSIVAGAYTYTSASNMVTFNPTSSLAAGADYIWTITGVRDLAGNVMAPVAVNFTTAS